MKDLAQKSFLSESDVSAYRENGFLFLPGHYSSGEMEVVRKELSAIYALDSPGRVMENDQTTVRSVYGSHADNPLMRRLAHHEKLVRPAMEILENDVYVHQFKINVKAAFRGDVWPWHQDFIFWQQEDGMPRPDVVNAVVFVDEVTEFNGPLMLLPGSHQKHVLPTIVDAGAVGWLPNLTADLKYSLSQDVVRQLVEGHQIAAPKGPVGSVLFFDCNLAHASVPNLSPFDRQVIIISFNSTTNRPTNLSRPRPEFLVSRDCSPIRDLFTGPIK